MCVLKFHYFRCYMWGRKVPHRFVLQRPKYATTQHALTAVGAVAVLNYSYYYYKMKNVRDRRLANINISQRCSFKCMKPGCRCTGTPAKVNIKNVILKNLSLLERDCIYSTSLRSYRSLELYVCGWHIII
mgnify:CR=1 FL=1